MNRVRIWDWPTRVVHWLLPVLVFFSWGSAEYGNMQAHRYSGYTMLGVLVFRLYWGFFGSATARFTNFVKGPRAVMAYMRSPSATKPIGHNPIGAVSVIVLLALLVVQVSLGLFAVDIDGLESGPLSYLVSFDVGRVCAAVHEIVFNILAVFIALHVAAILFYLFIKRDNLIRPMTTGSKVVAQEVQPIAVSAPLLRVGIGVVLAACVVWVIV